MPVSYPGYVVYKIYGNAKRDHCTELSLRMRAMSCNIIPVATEVVRIVCGEIDGLRLMVSLLLHVDSQEMQFVSFSLAIAAVSLCGEQSS